MNHTDLDGKISELDGQINGFSLSKKDGAFWKASWALVREIGGSFKDVRYPSRYDKDAAFARFQEIVKEMKEQREQHAKQFETRSDSSQELKSRIFAMAKSAWPHADGFEDFAMIVTGMMVLKVAAQMFAEVVTTLIGLRSADPREQEKNRLMGLSRNMKAAWDTFTSRKDELLPRDKAECFKILQGTQAELDKAWAEFKEEGKANYERREFGFEIKRQKKRDLILAMHALLRAADEKDAGKEASGIMDAWKHVGFCGRDHEDELWGEFKSAMDEFWQRRKQGAKSRLRERLKNQEAFYEKLKGAIEHDECVLEDKREKLSNVFDGGRADEIRSHLETVIASLEAKIESKKDKLSEVDASIDAIRGKLRDMD